MLTAGLLIGGKYRVIKKLGEGAMGSVWLAKNELTDREFAIKVLQPQAAASSTALARFVREAKVCGALRHPSILEIYDAGEAAEIGGAPYLVMERLVGAPLDVVVQQSGPLPPRLAIDVVVQISRGLELAHAKGIVHRDLKPANVFLHSPGTGAIQPKVLDFGISKVLDQTSPDVALTQTASILGSPMYMSPEQMGAGSGLDARSDIHALGILLWECLTGRAPFVSTSYNLLVVEIIHGPRPKLREVLPAASSALARMVERAFAIDPRSRFASATELADALEQELTRLGGPVLAGKTAVADVLGKLKLESTAPPRVHGSTTEPTSFEPAKPGSHGAVAGTLASSGAPSPPQPSAEGGRSPSVSSPDSFAETEMAAGNVRPARGPAAGAVSGARERTPATRATPKWLVVGVPVALALAGGTVMIIAHRPSSPTMGVSAEPPIVAAVDAATPTLAAPPPSIPSPPPAPLATPPASAPPPAASALPPSATPKKAPAKPRAFPPPPPARPRIDQSGL